MIKSSRDAHPGTLGRILRFEGTVSVGSAIWNIPIVDIGGKETSIYPITLKVRLASTSAPKIIGSTARPQAVDFSIIVMPLVPTWHISAYSSRFARMSVALLPVDNWTNRYSSNLRAALVRATEMTIIPNGVRICFADLQPSHAAARYTLCAIAISNPSLFEFIKRQALHDDAFPGVIAELLSKDHPEIIRGPDFSARSWWEWAILSDSGNTGKGSHKCSRVDGADAEASVHGAAAAAFSDSGSARSAGDVADTEATDHGAAAAAFSDSGSARSADVVADTEALDHLATAAAAFSDSGSARGAGADEVEVGAMDTDDLGRMYKKGTHQYRKYLKMKREEARHVTDTSKAARAGHSAPLAGAKRPRR